MPIQFGDPRSYTLTPQQMGRPDLIAAMMQGQQGGQSAALFPSQLQQQLIKTKFLPLSTVAQAASQLAYSNLVGPQFLAKLFGNADIRASMTDPQRDAMLAGLIKSGQLPQGIMQELMKYLGQSGSNISIPGLTQGSNQPVQQTQSNESMNYNPPPQKTIQQPKSMAEITEGESPSESGQVLPDKQTQPQATQPTTEQGSTWPERIGKYEGVKEFEKDMGKENAKALAQMGKEIKGSLQLDDKYYGMKKILTNPKWQAMRSEFPAFQGLQLEVLEKMGDKEQQKLIGNFIATANEIVKDTINTFQGTKMKGEVNIAQNMKINKSDPFYVSLGKVESAMQYKEMATKRNMIAGELMSGKRHLNEGQAMVEADKQIHGDEIRDKISAELEKSPEPTEADFVHTAKINNTTVDEVKKRWRAHHAAS